MSKTHILGFPRIGINRELKFALEAYWAGQSSQDELLKVGKDLRQHHWNLQKSAGLDFITVGDFAWYDHILEWTAFLGVVPSRFAPVPEEEVTLDTVFYMARGQTPGKSAVAACEMTKWFDTNYHYLVPELTANQSFRIAGTALFEQVEEAKALGHPVKAVIPGPLTWLWLGKGTTLDDGPFDDVKLGLLERLIPVYQEVLARLHAQGVTWVQLDEPVLALDPPASWLKAFSNAYTTLSVAGPKLLLATYFDTAEPHAGTIAKSGVHGVHIDLVRAPEQLHAFSQALSPEQVLSVGVLDGRNVWRADLDEILERLQALYAERPHTLWLAPSCSLLHVPVDLAHESELDAELTQWLSFATQKLNELTLLQSALHQPQDEEVLRGLQAQREALRARRQSSRIHNPKVQAAMAELANVHSERAPYPQRAAKQSQRWGLPLLPTTTIGSFPQTAHIRQLRHQWRQGVIGDTAYREAMEQEIAHVIREQEAIGLDVLVHGEAERNDMVEYFGELLAGFAFTRHGWVQSYGSRCVKPPILYGDVSRPAPMTVAWSTYAQSLTDKPVKGMLTGPVTLLQWSFVRDDQPRQQTCWQLALALREEVRDLAAAGIGIIQIDEPALREGLPLRREHWQSYLDWAVHAFRLATSGVSEEVQIHTHMCYSEFNDIMPAIAAMDADVITIETARSHMELLDAFDDFQYPNAMGPGVYDIHSPNVPQVDDMVALLRRALQHLPRERLWVNPDCGLKTRAWQETRQALEAMVKAANALRYT